MLWVLIRIADDSNEYLAEAILMSIHNIRFYVELMKIILELSSNTVLVSSMESVTGLEN